MHTICVYTDRIKKFSTHANTSSFNGLILFIHWLTMKKACFWQMLMYTTWILQQEALNSYCAQLLVPGSPCLPADRQTCIGSLVAGPGIPPVAKSQTFWSLQRLAQTHGCLAPKTSAWLVWLGFALGHTLAQLSRLCAWASASAFWCLRVPATRGGKAPAAGICVSVHGHTQWRFSVTEENSYKCSLTSS